MSFKVALKVVSCIVFASLCAFGASQSGEKKQKGQEYGPDVVEYTIDKYVYSIQS